jgi:hypothetical protein
MTKQVLFHTRITPDFIAFRLANFGGVFSYGQPSCPTLGPSRAGSICVCRADLGFLEEAFAFSCAAARLP